MYLIKKNIHRLYLVSIFFFLLSSFITCDIKNECSYLNTCHRRHRRSACQYQLSQELSSPCIEYESILKTDKQKQSILNKLNSRRNKVSAGELRSLPPAEGMMKLKWDKELETLAQRWANQCVEHSVPDKKDTCPDLDNNSIGQNIATVIGESPGLTASSLVDVWYMELMNINASALKHYKPSREAGYPHYEYFTQLVWAESSRVGCGGVKFKERFRETDVEKNRTIYRLVCNFNPAGNRLGQAVYTDGAACSRCPFDYVCDSIYNALCNNDVPVESSEILDTKVINYKQPYSPDTSHVSSQREIDVTSAIESENISEKFKIVDEDDTTFDFYSHMRELQPFITTTPSSVLCKDSLAVDDFLELLKRKLSSDPMFKDILQTTKISNDNTDAVNTDVTIAALVGKVYSKNDVPTTTKMYDSDFVNSTLLADLVEAVIFRSGGKESITDTTEESSQIPAVTPIKIQAELAMVKTNTDLTGHYFFPEDIEQEASKETTEMYYDFSNIPISDVMREIQDIKRAKATKSFLEEILESDFVTESTTTVHYLSPDDMNLHKSGRSNMKKFLEEIADKPTEITLVLQ